jgi:hypothetical protein
LAFLFECFRVLGARDEWPNIADGGQGVAREVKDCGHVDAAQLLANYLSSYLFDIHPQTHQTKNPAIPRNNAGIISIS